MRTILVIPANMVRYLHSAMEEYPHKPLNDLANELWEELEGTLNRSNLELIGPDLEED